ncbi:MAG: hypothetical protein CMLOHMNK_02674 [Steroidobacteraceae bacterium]|nr:hypothetical protein [Steroidobacteraceae bacterium]
MASAGTIYKWVDAQGTIHYSSQPAPGATELQIDAAPPRGASPANAPAPVADSSAAAAEPFRYTSCALTRPTNDQALPNAFAVSVAWRIEPALRSGDRVTLALDGKLQQGVSPTATSFSITPIDRGTHTLMVSVVDPNGRGLCQSSAVTFHVLQPSLLSPTRKTAPAPRPRPAPPRN